MRDCEYPLTVYYDASCPLCTSEMHALKARDEGDRLVLVDCSDASFEAESLPCPTVDRQSMLRIIHARDASGRWLSGIDVFVAAYRAAGFRLTAKVLDSALLRPLLDRMYPWVARHRQLLSALGFQRVFRRLMSSREAASCMAGECERRSSLQATPRDMHSVRPRQRCGG
jgi:predicted DCC family thiol-disulfide oxidoreductase YuxK